MSSLRLFFAAGALASGLAAHADTTPQALPFAQNWQNTALISSNDVWTDVPGIVGARGDNLTGGTATDPQTILAEDAALVLNVLANQTDPGAVTSGGHAEYEIANATVAFKGSGTADAPYLLISLNTTGRFNIPVSYLLRDIDATVNNAIQPVALQFRVGGSGAFTNVPAAFVADATSGPSLATLTTPVNVNLPASADNQPLVQLRIMTSNAAGVDESVGIDDIAIGGPAADVPPTVTSTTPSNNSTGVGAASNITINFSEAVTVSGAWFEIVCASSGSHSAVVTGGPASYTLNPDTDFAFGENCAVTVFASQVVDQDAPLQPMEANFLFNFTVVQDLPPTVVSTNPSNNQSNVPLTSNLTVNFSEPVTVTGSWFGINCAVSGAHPAQVSNGPTSYTLNPNVDFSALESCTLTIFAAQVMDQDGTPNLLGANVVVNFMSGASAADYYAGINASSAAQLRAGLHPRIAGHICVPYSGNGTSTWTVLEAADESPTDSSRVLDIYKNAVYRKGLDRAGVNNNPVTAFNREHTWPNSYGFNDRLTVNVNGQDVPNCPYTDTHMLYASNVQYNTDRGNLIFDDCPVGCSERVTEVNAGQGGPTGGVYPGNSNWLNGSGFQTWAKRKGDIARAVLYMDIRYDGGTHPSLGIAEPDLIVTDNLALVQTTGSGQFVSTAYMGKLSTLIAWHEADPPDAREQLRNEVVFGFQGNRNPFIDRPEWVRCLYTVNGCTAQSEQLFKNGFENLPP